VSSTGQRTLIALATYNERDNLEALTQGIREKAPAADVLVIDDGSPDGTGQLADDLARANDWLTVIHRPGKLGLGTALLEAMHFAMGHDYDLLVTMDADFSHHPRYLPALLAGMHDKDVMIGSRYVPGGGYIGWPLSRVVMSRGVNLLVRVLMRIPAKDCSGGFRCYRVSTLRKSLMEQMKSHGYSFQEEVLYRCRKAGARIGETPIVFENRRVGTSKVSAHEIIRSLGVILGLGVRAFFGLE
jgi:dolichol-phosphate mannosyltransferase